MYKERVYFNKREKNEKEDMVETLYAAEFSECILEPKCVTLLKEN